MRPDFGDVTAEYRALRSGNGFVEGFSELVWVRGPDAVSFLDGQLSQDVAAMNVGSTARSFALEPRGKVAGLLWLLRGEDRVGLVCDAGTGTAVAEHLDRFRFRVDAEIDPEPRALLEVWGSDLTAATSRLGADTIAGWSATEDRVTGVLPSTVLHRLVLSGFTVDDLVDAGFVRCGAVAADTVRVESGEPVMGRDVDSSTIPQESGLVAESVSFTKGCYLGQELVARIDSRGRVNRRLAGVRMATNVVPPVGAELTVDGEVMGSISTVGESLALRAPVGLGMVRREVEAGSTVDVRWQGGSEAAVVLELPLDHLGEE